MSYCQICSLKNGTFAEESSWLIFFYVQSWLRKISPFVFAWVLPSNIVKAYWNARL